MNTDRRKPEPGPELDLERELERVGKAWSRLEQVEPPDLVDQAVLSAALRAAARPPRRWRWAGAFATASVVVLAVSLVLWQDPEPTALSPVIDGLDLPERGPARTRPDVRDSAAAPGPATAAEVNRVPRAETAAGEANARPERRVLQSQSAAPELEVFDSRSVQEEQPILDPETWIARLRSLRESGEVEAFRNERDAFRNAYPDYPLPSELRD